ncbi:MAG: hypothetical protein GF372_08855, partial [Candidatus Marinimicrobia bacterium]|nr:hypothetical protein [Candidatus Neomarinimicrobiota bacterium]
MIQAFWFTAYNILVVPIMYAGFRIAGLFNAKVRNGISGRSAVTRTIRKFKESAGDDSPLFIIHCASLGEYEMAKPVIQKLKESRPETRIVLTFFSPSGYYQVQDKSEADLVTYLPFDSVRALTNFFNVLQPEKLILTSYEAWPNLIWTADRLHIEIYIISARMQDSNLKTYPVIRSFYASIYSCVDHIYPITERDRENYLNFFLKNSSGELSVFGNTRYDQVIERAQNAAGKNLLPESFSSSIIFAGGSVWPEDNKVILKPLGTLAAGYPDLKFVFAPHEPTQKHLDELIQWCDHNDLDYALFSELSHADDKIRVILVDVIGQLAEIYHDCDIAFVGGAFTGSVHNVMEPAVAR